MRVFFGVRTTDSKKKGLAGQLYKKKLTGQVDLPMTKDQQYKAALDAKINSIMQEIANGKKKSFHLPGTKEEPPKERSRNFKATMEQLAMKKLQKETEKNRKKQRENERAKKAEQQAKELAAKAEENKKLLQQKQDAEKAALAHQQAQHLATTHNVFGHPHEDKNSWW
jgi:hypothetical protein